MEYQTGLGSKAAYLFPGQGTQWVGMGRDLYEASPAARRVFQEADEVLVYPLTRLIFEGPEGELTKTVNAQPAILTVSVALLKGLEEVLGPEGVPQPSFVAGHSVGEYTALVAAGSLTVAQAVSLVRLRGRLMQEVSERRPGGMLAVLGLDELTVEEVCLETGAEISTVNADDQVVVGGDRLALARTADLLLLRGAKKVVPLAVSGAFHSSLMAPAVEGLREALAVIPLKDLKVPVVANCSATPIYTAEQVKEELVRQLYRCVQWRRCVNYMLNAGVRRFYEIGPGRVLSSLVKRVSREAQALAINDLSAMRALAV